MRILLTGATGTAGSAVLREAMNDKGVQEIVVVARRKPPESSTKVRFLELSDFTDWTSLKGRLQGVDAVIWCLGISQMKVSREELARVTHDFTLAGARAIQLESPNAAFVFLSGGGADPRLKSRMPFAIEKGRTENDLDALGLARLHHARPAYIHPEVDHGHRGWAEILAGGVAPIMRAVAPFGLIDARDLARAMITLAIDGDEKHVLENRDLRRIAGLKRGT